MKYADNLESNPLKDENINKNTGQKGSPWIEARQPFWEIKQAQLTRWVKNAPLNCEDAPTDRVITSLVL